MRQQLAVGVVAVAVMGGIGTAFAVDELRGGPSPAPADTNRVSPSQDPKPKPSESPTTEARSAPAGRAPAAASPKPETPALLPLASMLITPGAVGPVSVGVGQDAAVATGYFDTDVESSRCGVVVPLGWKEAYGSILDLRTLGNGSIDSIGVGGPGPRTRSGLQVGSTFAQVREVLGEGSVPEATGSGGTGLFVAEGTGWIGFLFDTAVDQLGDDDVVSFVEVTRGRRPALARDGC